MNRDFFLGILVSIALIMLWRKEHQATVQAGASAAPGTSPIPSYVGGDTGACPGCAGDSPAYAAAPATQELQPSGVVGMVSPSAPPLGGAGTIPAETSYMSQIKLWTPLIPPRYPPVRSNIVPAGTYTAPASYAPNTSGPTPRAVATAPTYANQAFVNRAQASNLGTNRGLLLKGSIL